MKKKPTDAEKAKKKKAKGRYKALPVDTVSEAVTFKNLFILRGGLCRQQ